MGLITPENTILSTQYPVIYNLAIVRATTTNAGDSIKITSGSGTALSSANVGKVRLGATTAGQQTTFDVTSDVTILLTGATWGLGGNGDITGGLLRVLACNDNGTLKWGVAYLGGRHTLLTTDTNATQANVNLPEEVLCNTAIGSSTNTCTEIGFFRADFDDTGGAAEDLWAIQTGIGDVVTGRSADGMWQPINQGSGNGWTAAATSTIGRWTQIGRMIHQEFQLTGTSNATTSVITLPAKANTTARANGVTLNSVDNGAAVATVGLVNTRSGAALADLYTNSSGSVAWTNSGTKTINGYLSYEVGPAASFLD